MEEKSERAVKPQTSRAGHGLASCIALGGLIAFAIAAYYYRLRVVPAGYYQDTGAVILNADCLAATGRDEYGIRFPYLGLTSFGEGKAAGFTFLIAAVARFMRVTPLVTRVVSSTCGFVAVAALLLFAYFTRAVARPRRVWVYGVALCLCALSSWVLVLHRFPTECTLVNLFIAGNLASAYGMLRTGKLRYAVINGFFVGMGGYAYHSLKVMLVLHPFLVAAGTWQARSLSRRAAINVVLANVGAAAFFAGPLLYDIVTMGETMRRFVLQGGPKDPWLLRLTRYFAHVDMNFLFLSGDPNRRHGAFMGVLSVGLLPFLAWGFFLACRRARRGGGFWVYVLGMTAIAFIPAALAPDPPHAIHANAATLPTMLLALLGMMTFDRYVSLRRKPFPWPAIAVAGVFAVASVVAVGNSLVFYFGDEYAEQAKGWWRPHADVEREEAQGNASISPGDHGTGTVFLRAGSVANGDLRYCNAPK
jgi:hypothetical protein